MKSALIRLRDVRDQVSNTEAAIADYILDNQETAINMSVRELADATFSSPAAVIRLCHHVGFSGFKEFKKSVIFEVAARKESIDIQKQQITNNDTLEEIVEKVSYRNIISIEETKNLIDTDELAECVKLLKNARTILLFGIGSSQLVAQDAHLKLLRLSRYSIACTDSHSQILQAKTSHPDDLGIVFSYSGETAEMVMCMHEMKNNGTPTIAITRYGINSVSKLATYTLFTSSVEPTFRMASLSSRIAQHNLFDILYTAYTAADYEYCAKQLSRTLIQKPYFDYNDFK